MAPSNNNSIWIYLSLKGLQRDGNIYYLVDKNKMTFLKIVLANNYFCSHALKSICKLATFDFWKAPLKFIYAECFYYCTFLCLPS